MAGFSFFGGDVYLSRIEPDTVTVNRLRPGSTGRGCTFCMDEAASMVMA